MLKKQITYTDYNGVERTEDFYFNLNKAELTEMELSTSGGMSTLLTDIVNSQNVEQMVVIFKKIIMKSYGQKSDDGRRFFKSEEARNEFEQTEAYSELFVELLTNTDSAVQFINGIMPASFNEVTPAEAEKVLQLKLPESPKPTE